MDNFVCDGIVTTAFQQRIDVELVEGILVTTQTNEVTFLASDWTRRRPGRERVGSF